MPNEESERSLQGYFFPLSSAQKRVWILTQMRRPDGAYNVSQALHIRGALNRAALEQSLYAIIERHEILRTGFVLVGDEPAQVIQASVEWRMEFEREGKDGERLTWTQVLHGMQREAALPFDLTKPPLLRATLYQLDAEEFLLFLNLHHIACDGWSLGILMREMSTLYPLFCESGRFNGTALPDLEFQYADYSEWHREWLQSAASASHLAYWSQKLGGVLPRLEFPTDFARSPVSSQAGGVVRKTLDRTIVEDVQRFSRQSGTTVFMTMLAAFFALVRRYSRAEDIIIGTPVANRPHAAFENIIGLFVNSLALRTRVGDGWTFAQLLEQVKEDCLAAYTHQDMPFEMLIDRLQPERSSSFSPVFQHMFAFQNATLGNIVWPGLEVSSFNIPNGSSKLDLTLIAEATPDGFLLTLEFAADLFRRETAVRLLNHYSNLLSAALLNPHHRIDELPLLDARELQLIQETYTNPRADFEPVSLVEWFEKTAREYPDRIAVSHGLARLSYAQLNSLANQLARLLRARGIHHHHTVALSLHRSPSILVAILAVLKSGAAYLPLDPSYPSLRLHFLLHDSRPDLLLLARTPAASALAHDAPCDALFFDDLLEQAASLSPDNLGLPIDPAQAAYVIYTSGSTGEPKGCVVTHANVTRLLQSAEREMEFGCTDVWTMFHSYAFDFSVWEIWGALLYGGRVVVVEYWESREPEEFYKLLVEEGVTVLNQTPSAFRQLQAVDATRRGDELSLRLLIFGGEALDLRSLTGWLERHGDRTPHIINMYGITETTVHVTLRRITAADIETRAASPLGSPLPDLQLYLLDKRMSPQPIGIAGEIYVGGAGVARGYLHRPALTAERFLPDPFCRVAGARMYRSGDIGRRRADGELEYLGRADSQVKIRGFRIEPAEVEASLRAHRAVSEAAVIVKDEANGERRLVAYVIVDERSAPAHDELRDFLRLHLPEYMLPSVFIALPSLPLTANGKLDRRALPEPSPERPDMIARYVAARTETERALADIWSEVLGVARVGVEDNFFGLGGDSIMALQVAAKARRRGLLIRPQDILQHQTISELVAVAEQAAAPTVVAKPDGEFPLTPVQNWFFELDVPHRSHWNQSVVVEIKHHVGERDIAASLQAIARLHTAFSLRFCRQDGRWIQRYADDEASIHLALFDLSGLDADAQQAALLGHIAEMQTALDIENGTLARAAYFKRGSSVVPLLALTMHHLITDGVSWRIIMEDLAEALSQCRQQKPLVLQAPSVSFGSWARRLEQAAAHPALTDEVDYWVDDCAIAATLPTDYPAAPEQNTEASLSSLTTTLPLHEPARPHHARAIHSPGNISLLLLASLAQFHFEVTRQTTLRIAMEDHGRRDAGGEAIDLSRTVGWFTVIYPLTLRGCDEGDPYVLLDHIEQQLEAVPQNGFGYGLLRYTAQHPSIREKLAAQPAPHLSFNYLGQWRAGRVAGESFKLRRDLVVNTHAADALRPFMIDLVAFVEDGELKIEWLFSDRLHKRSTIERWAEIFVRHFQSLLRETSHDRRRFRPSDFPLAALSPHALGRLSESLPHHIQDLYTLSPMQEGMLFHSISDERAGFYFEQLTARITGAFEAEAFRQAWHDLLDRHASLRTCFIWEGLERPLQMVLREAEIPFRYHDWQTLDPAGQASRLESLLDSDRGEKFVLSQCPLMRITLIRTGQHAWRLLWSYHHILLDGWSLPLIFIELLECYAARSSGRNPDLPAPPQFRDYISWLHRQDTTRAENFWRARLQGATPTRVEAQKAFAEEGDQTRLEELLTLDDASHAALQSFAQSHNLTLNTIVQGAWALLLGRYGGGDDVIFGSTFSGREAELPAIERAVGLFINTLPVRVRINRRRCVASWLDELQTQQFEMLSYTYCRLVDIQRWSGVKADEPLFESLVVFENYPVGEALRRHHETLDITDIEIRERTNYPLTLAVIPGHTLTLKLDYHAGRFTRATASAMLAEMGRTLTQMCDSPSDSVGDLLRRVALASDAHADGGLGVDALSAEPVCLHSLFERQARLRPQAVALDDGTGQLSYEELNRRANQLAAGLRRAGIGAEKVVGLLLARSFDLIVGMLAVLKAGGAYLPLDPLHPPERLRYMLRDSGAALLLTRSEFVSLCGDDSCPRMLLDASDAPSPCESTADTGAEIHATNLAYIIYTSGTTGEPKGVAVSHYGLENLIREQRELFRVDDASRIYQFAAQGFDASVSEIFVALASGATLCLPDATRPSDWQDLTHALNLSRATHVTLPPSILSTLEPSALPSLKTLVVAGEAGSANLFRQWSKHCRVINAYGPTEATVCASMKTITPVDAGEQPTLGSALRATSLYLLNGELEPVPVGVAGEIYIGGVGLARGYLNQPGLTAAAFLPNPFASRAGERLYRTGDWGVRVAHGEIQFAGRRDQQVKLRGYRIELAEIETTLSAHPSVEAAVVVVRETAAQTHQLVAHVVLQSGASVSMDELRRYAGGRLPAYEVPGVFVETNSFPLTPNKKIDRAALSSASQEAVSASDSGDAPTTEAERILAAIWADVLHVTKAGVRDNFFEAGGDSILSLQIASRAREASLDITPREVMSLQTIERIALAARVQRRPETDTDEGGEPFELTPIQQWFFEKNWPHPHHWNLSVVLETGLPLSHAALCAALRVVFERHAALRLRFVNTDEGRRAFYQTDAPPPEPEWLNLTTLSIADAGDEFRRAATMAQSGLDLERGTLFRVVYAHMPEGASHRLALIAHHLIVDAVSWATLCEELLSAYRQHLAGHPISLPARGVSYKTWAERLQRSADGEMWHDEKQFWLDVCSTRVPAFRTDFDDGAGANISADRQVVACDLNEADTSALLKETRAAYNTSVQELLLTALAQTVAAYTGSASSLFDVESHGRESLWDDVDVSRSVGWFTALYPARLVLPSIDADARSSIVAVKEQMRAIPHQGIGYGVLRYLARDAALRQALKAAPVPAISFNYLGTTAAAASLPDGFRVSDEDAGDAQHPSQSLPHLIEINAAVRSGRLALAFSYSAKLFHRSTVQALADGFVDKLQRLIEHCRSPGEGAYTPSDFEGIELSVEDLNAILDDVAGEQSLEL